MTVQVHRVYIRTTPERLWEAITSEEWGARYGYGGHVSYDLRAGGAYRVRASEEMKKSAVEQGFDIPEIIVDGEVLEADPPRKLVQTWRMLMDPTAAAEGFTTLTYEIVGQANGVCKLTLTHELANAPSVAAMTAGDGDAEAGGGGWPWVLSDLKTLLETGGNISR
ncbi:SRPBCC domain-containing protein [Pilimelia anulata]|nr:SRPBCC domain-containing protein [Pilimelia anulata]